MVFPNSKAGCSRVPPQSATLTNQYCYSPDPVRLACLIHATSVRSEPESNSQKENFESLWRPSRVSGHHTNQFLSSCSASLPTAPRGASFRSAFFSAPSVLKDRVAPRSAALRRVPWGGERGHSVSKNPEGRKGESEKMSKKVSGGAARRATPPRIQAQGPGFKVRGWRSGARGHPAPNPEPGTCYYSQIRFYP